MARRSIRFTVERKAAFIAALREKLSILHACREVGISRPTAYKHREEDPAFRQAWDDAIEDAVDALEASVYERALNGTPVTVYDKEGNVLREYVQYDTTAQLAILNARRATLYRHTSKVTVENTGEVTVVVDDARERLAGRIARIAARTTETGDPLVTH